MLADTAVLIADGGRVLSNLATLRDQATLFAPGGLGSDAVACALRDRRDAATQDRRVRAKTREHVWSLIEKRHGRIPPSRVADRDLGKTVVMRMDASLVIAHSDKELAAGTFEVHLWASSAGW